ncbi:hypothetical protein ACPPVT_07335 [Angustibacter sp. McL0619]|uniref:hypothetical protein n=1 Tax=Angustibacter sp. McL0619 TaxID=3415676 RepID=UPI003CF663B4
MSQARATRTVLIAVAALALATVGAAPAVAVGARSSGASAARADSQSGAPALARRVATDIQPGAGSARVSGTGSTRPHGVRHASAASSSVAPRATAPGVATDPSSLLSSFNGTSSRDSEFTNFNLRFEPPDQGLCAGAGFIIEPVNSAYRIYNTAGQTLRGPFNVNELFNEGGKEFTSDPRCWYDPSAHAWFATILFLNDTFTEGRLDIAVNPSDDPTGLWTEYQIDTTFDGRDGEPNLPGCPCFGDQPRIGIDQTNLYITTDEFSINGPQFYGGQIYAIDKSDLVAGAATAHFVRFGNLHLGGALSGAPQPALSIGTPNAEYFLSQLDPQGAGDNRIGVWAMTNRGRVGTGGSPTLSKLTIGSLPYVTPARAKQRGSTSTLDAGDDRMQQASFVNGSLWGELGTGLSVLGAPANRAGAAWFQVRPRLSGNVLSGASIVRQGYLVNPSGALLYPAIQPDAAGNAAMVFTLTGANRFPSVGYSVLKAGETAFSTPRVAAAGTGPYDPAATRWGDYSFAVPDPGSDSAWLASEYIPPVSSQTTTRTRNWGTRVIHVKLG